MRGVQQARDVRATLFLDRLPGWMVQLADHRDTA